MSNDIYSTEMVRSEIKSLLKIRSLNRPYRKKSKDLEKYVVIPHGKKCANGCGHNATVFIRGRGGKEEFVCNRIPGKCPAIASKCFIKNISLEEFSQRISHGRTKITVNGKSPAQIGADKMREVTPCGLTKAHLAAKSVRNRKRSGRQSLVEGEENTYKQYKREVYRYTRQSYFSHQDKINPKNKPIGKCQYHIDHIFSIIDGFRNKVPAEIVGHYCNLQMLWYSENTKKNNKSWCTLDELYRQYQLYQV